MPGTWLPLTLRLTNNGPALQIRVRGELPNSLASYAQDLQLPGGETTRVEFYMPMEQVARELRLTISAGDTLLADQTLALRPRTDERMLGIVAGQPLELRLPRRQDLAGMPFTALAIAPADLPDRALGLGSLGLILIDDIPPESLRPSQIQALLAWVYAGGHLIIGGGPAAAATISWLPESLPPASIGADTPIADAPLATLADAAGPGSLAGVQLTPLTDSISTGPDAAPAWVARPFGSGRVTQLAFAPGLSALRSWAAATTFWDKLLQPATIVDIALGQQTNVDRLQERILAGALTALPTISLPPIDGFFIALIVYAIVVGPLLAIALRTIDRQAWSWLLIPVIAVGCGALLLTLAVNLRADERVVTQVSLVEEIGADQIRVRTLVGMLTPQSQTLMVNVPAGALSRSLQAASGLYGEIGEVGGTILEEQARIPVQIDPWSLQGLIVDQVAPRVDVSSEITIDAKGVQVRVRNLTDQILSDVVAFYGDQVVRLGDLRPGDEASSRWPPRLAQSPPDATISAIILQDIIAANQRPGQTTERRLQVRQALIDAAVVRGDKLSDPGPLVLALMERSPQPVTVEADGAARQDMALLVLRPSVIASGSIMLPDNWLQVSPIESQRPTCSTGQRYGIEASPAPATIVLRLPADLAPLRAEQLSLSLNSSRDWPSSGLKTEIYDWSQQLWVEQDFDGPGDLKVDAPAAYLSRGRLMLRLSGTVEQAGCLIIDSSLQGTMP